ncbi:unnamed protein product [Closterium sp. NIES-54]
MYGTQADLWSLGILLFLLLCGVPPFWAATGGGIRRAVQQQQVAFLSPRWKDVSDEMKQLLLMLLEKNPSDRLTAAEALGMCIVASEVVSLCPLGSFGRPADSC